MSDFVGIIIGGLAVGTIYGLLGFSIVLLHKATGVANFAQGSLAMLAAFVALQLSRSGLLAFWMALALCAAVMLVAGLLLYLLVLRPRDDAGTLNITIRTLGINLLIAAVVDYVWAQGQPFPFPNVLPISAAFTLGNAVVSWLALGTIALFAVLIVGFGLFFRGTSLGLLYLAAAERPETARLLGVRTRRLTMLAWGFSALIAFFVAILIAPVTLVSDNMMDVYLLFAFAAAVIGGLDSLPGALIGGLIVGVVYSAGAFYLSSELATLGVFCLVLLSLLMRPQGLFGQAVGERL